MTHVSPYILASADDAVVKMVFWGVIILIVVIVKVVKFIGKVISPTSTLPPATPPPAMQNLPQPMPMSRSGALPLPPLARKAVKARRTAARQAPPIPVKVGSVMEVVSALQQARASATTPPPPIPARSRVAGWLDAETLRAQFILSEAMKPPVSLK